MTSAGAVVGWSAWGRVGDWMVVVGSIGWAYVLLGFGRVRAGGMAVALAIDDDSEQSRLLQRQINGQFNRLSEQSRDSIVKGLQEVFARNSFTLCCHTLRGCLLSVCSNATQLMSTLIPHYAGLVAALHYSVDFQIGSYILESLVVRLYTVSYPPCVMMSLSRG